ncbi:MAG: hypothetical protein M3P93_00375, partial [Actinomycetota bacterium]|nr:hypothetical protein [Actinomycetota bacterium]
MHLPSAAVVQQSGQPVQRVHFPLDGVLAVQAAASGSPVAVAVVGREGAVGPSGAGEGPRLRAVSAGPARV